MATKPPTKKAPAQMAGEFVFNLVPLTEIPNRTPTGETKYGPIVKALREAPEGQAIALTVPKGTDAKAFSSNMLNSVRRDLPATRSRTTSDTVYLWIGTSSETSRTKP